MIEKLGGRKFIIAVLAIIFAFVLVILKVVQPDDFLEFVKWALGIFTVGNAVVDVTGIVKNVD